MSAESSSRFQVSIRTFFVVATIGILAVSHWNTSRQLRMANIELRKLRNEAGYLTVDDRTQVHVMMLQSAEPDTWRWRVFIPKGVKYSWHIACEEIPLDSPPTGNKPWMGVSNSPYWKQDNEALVTAKLVEKESGDYTLSVRSKIGDSKDQMGGVSMEVPQEKLQWRDESPSRQVDVMGSRESEIVDPDGPIVLLIQRAMRRSADGSVEMPDEPMPGFMIWMKRR